jgi:hypothetical protein
MKCSIIGIINEIEREDKIMNALVSNIVDPII